MSGSIDTRWQALGRLDEQLRAAGIPIHGVRLIGEDQAEPDFDNATQQQQDDAAAIVAAFDWDEIPPRLRTADEVRNGFWAVPLVFRALFWSALVQQESLVGQSDVFVAGALMAAYSANPIDFAVRINLALTTAGVPAVFSPWTNDPTIAEQLVGVEPTQQQINAAMTIQAARVTR